MFQKPCHGLQLWHQLGVKKILRHMRGILRFQVGRTRSFERLSPHTCTTITHSLEVTRVWSLIYAALLSTAATCGRVSHQFPSFQPTGLFIFAYANTTVAARLSMHSPRCWLRCTLPLLLTWWVTLVIPKARPLVAQSSKEMLTCAGDGIGIEEWTENAADEENSAKTHLNDVCFDARDPSEVCLSGGRWRKFWNLKCKKLFVISDRDCMEQLHSRQRMPFN